MKRILVMLLAMCFVLGSVSTVFAVAPPPPLLTVAPPPIATEAPPATTPPPHYSHRTR